MEHMGRHTQTAGCLWILSDSRSSSFYAEDISYNRYSPRITIESCDSFISRKSSSDRPRLPFPYAALPAPPPARPFLTKQAPPPTSMLCSNARSPSFPCLKPSARPAVSVFHPCRPSQFGSRIFLINLSQTSLSSASTPSS